MSIHTVDTDTMKISEIYNEKELSDMVFNTIQYYRQRAERLGRENELLREKGQEMADGALKNEIERLKERLRLSYGEFSSEKEKKAYEDFEKRHMHERETIKIQSGKCPYLIPIGTGIGTCLKVVCPICGTTEDITDVEVW